MATTKQQTPFGLSSTPTMRVRLSREHRQAYDAGKVDAYLEILQIINKSKELHWDNLVFTADEAGKYTKIAVAEVLRQRVKAEKKVKNLKRLLATASQLHADF